jgi:hypothetical protein
MARTNAKYKSYITYFDIQYVASEGKWYAWYLIQDREAAFREAMEGEDS